MSVMVQGKKYVITQIIILLMLLGKDLLDMLTVARAVVMMNYAEYQTQYVPSVRVPVDGRCGMKLKKIIMMDCDCPSIYMPIGKPSEGGTCAFATDKCMQYCPSGMVINDIERGVLQYFRDKSAKIIIERLHKEFCELLLNPRAERMLQWWTWGDCLPELTKKVAKIIISLHDKGIPQYGFTRNKKLWEAIPNYSSLHLGLTVDDMDEALKLSVESGKMTACPDFEAGYAQMIFTGKVRARCSGWWCITESGETRNSDCTQCLAAGEGCYHR